MPVDREHVLEVLAAHRDESRGMGVRHLFRVCDLRYRLEELLEAQVDFVTTGGLRPEIRDEVMSAAIRAA
jgi:predicted nucleotidyltransferase